MKRLADLIASLTVLPVLAVAQSASVRGVVKDTSGGVVQEAVVSIENTGTNGSQKAKTNKDGLYFFGSLQPGAYKVAVSHEGFKPVTTPQFELRSGDIVPVDLTLEVGSTVANVTVTDEPPIVQSESGTVRTVISGALANSLPLNGQTLQPLLSLVPGVAYTPNNLNGDFSVNGQRSTSNSYQVDGLSANAGTYVFRASPSNLSGVLPALTAAGTTGTMASFESVREIEIQTSSFAPEYGRTPGGQISLVTKSGTDVFHGSAFDYFRNEAFDASDWLANANRLAKPRARLRNTGGSLGGPVRFWKRSGTRREFFFFSYENQGLDRPKAVTYQVPSLSLRSSASPFFQPILNSFPIPNGLVDATGLGAIFNYSYSDKLTTGALSGRFDENLTDRLRFYLRYNRAPSSANARYGANAAIFQSLDFAYHSISAAAVWNPTPSTVVDTRANFTANRGRGSDVQQPIAGAVPFTFDKILSPALAAAAATGLPAVTILSPPDFFTTQFGSEPTNRQRQFQLVSSVAMVVSHHTLKAGADLRAVLPGTTWGAYPTLQLNTLSGLTSGRVDSFVLGNSGGTLRTESRQLSFYLQDEWRIKRELIVTVGARWDINPAPFSRDGQSPVTMTNSDVSQTSLKLTNSLYPTDYREIAPRLGLAWKPGTGRLVFRGGIGLFRDAAIASIGNVFNGFPYSYGFSLGAQQVPVTIPGLQVTGALPMTPPFPNTTVASSSFGAPRIIQGNVTVEAALSRKDALSVGYVASTGSRLTSVRHYVKPNSAFSNGLDIIDNQATSSYNALQMRLEHRLSHGTQLIASHTWSHALDTVSNETTNTLEKGDAGFDVRHITSFAIATQLPRSGRAQWLTNDFQVFIMGRIQSAPPLDVKLAGNVIDSTGTMVLRRPDLVLGVPVWRDDPNVPGGRRINAAAFSTPPAGVQGNLGRDIVRGFGLSQFDAGISKAILAHDRLRVALRADAFNILNHPNFAQPTSLSVSTTGLFGTSQGMLNSYPGTTQALPGAVVASPFAVGGPRTLQISARLTF